MDKIKPICVHNHLILGLQKPPIWPIKDDDQLRDLWSQMKMSKSIPNSAVFIHDSSSEIKKKIKSAFCPEGNIVFNPILDWAKSIIFREKDSCLKIERPEKFGGNLEINSYQDLENYYLNKKIHPLDLKNRVSEKLIEILQPARSHFENQNIKRMKEHMEELLITR
ncbi:MAG: hypothetical protein ACFFA3_10950 [Promethearchaeota archaeon]